MKVGYDNRSTRGRWKPGVSGNPKGRPKRQLCITHMLRTLGHEKIDHPDGGLTTRMKLLAAQVWKAALAGEPWAIEFIVNRIEGKPATQTENMMLEGLAFVEERKIVMTPLPVPPGVTLP